MIKPPKNYYILKEGTRLEGGDLVLFYNSEWKLATVNFDNPTMVAGKVYSTVQERPFIFARKIKQKE